MKVAGNRVGHIVDFFHSELSNVYDGGEISALINEAFEHYMGFDRNDYHNRLSENLNQSDLLKLYDCCKELKTGKPIQYILKNAWFYGLKFSVDENVLIPRPETEELVHLIIKQNSECHSLLDIGTGSGCIPISIKHHLTNCDVSACDISAGALNVAKKNSEINNCPVLFIETDVLNDNTFSSSVKSKFELIVSNPPYIKQSEKNSLHTNVVAHEPHLALFVNDMDEIIFYRKIINACKDLLMPKGKLYFELNPLTANEVKSYADNTDLFTSVELINDMSGKLRFMKAIME